MKHLTFCLFIFVGVNLFAKEKPQYPVSGIPDSLKEGMYAVIREQSFTFQIHDRNSSSYKVRRVITILNQNAKAYASLTLQYDKFIKIDNIKGVVYSKDGEVIRRLRSNDIIDQSYVDNYSLFDDNRIKHVNLDQNEYPYTIEFEYTLSFKFLYSIPDFSLYSDDEISIQNNLYEIIYPKDYRPRYKVFNLNEPSISSVGNNIERMSWAFNNIKPKKFERNSSQSDAIPNIIAGPVDFEFDGYAGKMDTWENLGKWQIKLNTGRDKLPEATRQKVRDLTQGISSEEEKIKLLYEFMQNKTRYVSIQLGIGGFQPFDATSVDQLGYGDCKALSNYMVSLLKEAGIKAYYTQIYAGSDNKIIPKDFPIDYFNHIVVAVPNASDTIWLECTSQTNPFGYLGTFTGDRYALMITDDGGRLVKTPSYSAQENSQSRTAKVFVDDAGNAKASVRTIYKGVRYESGRLDHAVSGQYDEQKKWLQNNIKIPAFDVVKFTMVNNKKVVPSAIVDTELALPRFATVSGKRIFLTPNLMNKSSYIPEKLETRKTNIVLRIPYIDVDTIQYHLPEGIYPEFLPEKVSIKSRFGEYESIHILDQGQLLYIRKLKMIKGEFPPDTYKEFTDFYKSINKADNTKIVFMSKT